MVTGQDDDILSVTVMTDDVFVIFVVLLNRDEIEIGHSGGTLLPEITLAHHITDRTEIVRSDTVSGEDEALRNWEALKKKEKTERATVTDELKAVHTSLPALIKAQKIGKEYL